MLKPGGYYSVTEADGAISREGDTFSCAHGNEIVRVPPGHQANTPICKRCMGRLCVQCAAAAAQSLRCVPTEQMLCDMESRGRAPRPTHYQCAHERPADGKTPASSCRGARGRVEVPPGADPLTVGAWCRQCGGHLCEGCAARFEGDLTCPPFERMLAERDARGRFRAAVGG